MPVLRLPLPAVGVDVPEGYDTAVVLPLREESAVAAVRAQLEALDDGLLLALPALAEIEVQLPGQPARVLRDVADRWRLARRDGEFPAGLLADRPTEERERTRWSLTWALPRDGSAPPAVLHAPTPSDEPLPWPALLVGTFPLDPARRHVAPGPATDLLVREAAAAYAGLLAELAAEGTDAWPLVPVGLPAGALDGALRAALLDLLPGAPLLRAAGGEPAVPPARRRRPGAARRAPTPTSSARSRRSSAGSWPRRRPRRPPSPCSACRGSRSRTSSTSSRRRGTWRAGCTCWARSRRSPTTRKPERRSQRCPCPWPAAASPVARARSCCPPASPRWPRALATLGVRVVDPEVAADPAARRLLERLGARPTAGRAALELPEVVHVVAALADDEAPAEPDPDGDPVRAVLTLVAAAVAAGGLAPGDLPSLADLPLPDDDGDPAPAGALALPGSAAARLLDHDAVGVVAAGILEAWGPEVLRAVGVLDGLAVLRAADVALDAPPEPALEEALDGVGDWLDELGGLAADAFGSTLGATVGEVDAVRDLDLVLDDAWPEVLAMLAAAPDLRAALLTPVRVAGPAGGSVPGPSYAAWWLRERLAEGGAWADPDAPAALAALLPPAPPALAAADPAVRAALGAVRNASELDAQAVQGVLAGLADPRVDLDAGTALGIWAALAELAGTVDVVPTDRVRVLHDGGTVVVDADRASVAGDPMVLQRGDLGPFVVAPGPRAARDLADLLDLPLAADLARGVVDEGGARLADVPPAAAALLPGGSGRWCEHGRAARRRHRGRLVGRRRRARARRHARRARARPGVRGGSVGAPGGAGRGAARAGCAARRARRSALRPPGHVEQAEQAEADAGERRPDPPAATGRLEPAVQQQRDDERDGPQADAGQDRRAVVRHQRRRVGPAVAGALVEPHAQERTRGGVVRCPP